MDFLSEITQEADESGAYQEFLLYYKHKGKTLHLFFEGKDDPSFYSGFINEIIINDLSPHNTYICYSHICGDKYKVYEMYVKITNRFTKSRCLFFVDKDFSDYLEQNYPYDEHIYVTDFYSIENFLSKYLGHKKSISSDILFPYSKFEESFFLYSLIKKRKLYLSMLFDQTSTSMNLAPYSSKIFSYSFRNAFQPGSN